MDKFHLSNTERQVMEKLWKHEGMVSQAELLQEFFEEGKVWSRQTLNTLLQRLEAKSFVVRERRMVRASCTREQFGLKIAHDAMDQYCHGHFNKFVVAFAEECDVSDKEKQKLKKLIDENS